VLLLEFRDIPPVKKNCAVGMHLSAVVEGAQAHEVLTVENRTIGLHALERGQCNIRNSRFFLLSVLHKVWLETQKYRHPINFPFK
jgi:hypothetical protein